MRLTEEFLSHVARIVGSEAEQGFATDSAIVAQITGKDVRAANVALRMLREHARIKQIGTDAYVPLEKAA